MNRKCEFLLHNVEFLSCVASIQNSYKYPSSELDRIWKLLLLNQFHDVLPGSSIGLVSRFVKSKLNFSCFLPSWLPLFEA